MNFETAPLYGNSNNGGDSSAFGIIAVGGGHGGGQLTGDATSEGSGGGGSGYVSSTDPGKVIGEGLGNNGGYGKINAGLAGGGGGGGGTGSQGEDAAYDGGFGNSLGGNAGNGTNKYSEWITAISSLLPNDWKEATKSGYIAGGGAGGSWGANIIPGGFGGGGTGGTNNGWYGFIPPTNAINNTGSGGGGGGSGGQIGASGGSGLIVIRYFISLPLKEMSSTELKCYKERYPNDLSKLTDSELQEHWDTKGRKEGRYNICPSPQTKSGLYEYKGCYNDNDSIGALSNFRGTVSSIDQCSSIAEKNKELLFGMKSYGECWTGSDENRALKFGENFNRDSCGIMGKNNTQNIYKRSESFPIPPPLPIKKLTHLDFSNDNLTDNFKNYKNNNIIFLSIFIILIIITIIYI